MHKLWKKLVVSILICLFVSANSFVTFANQTIPPEFKEQLRLNVSEGPASDCQNTFVPLADVELFELMAFLDLHFSNKASNTSLMNIAIMRFSNYQRTIWGTLNQITPGSKNIDTSATFDSIGRATANWEQYSTELAAFDACKDLAEKYVELGKEQLKKKLRNSTAQKKTALMLEKYQAINQQMADLNFKVSTMYSYIQAFVDKLPGFVKECVTG